MKRSEEIRKKIKEKELEKEGWARDFRTQTSRLNNEILELSWELADIRMDLRPDYEVRVKTTTSAGGEND